MFALNYDGNNEISEDVNDNQSPGAKGSNVCVDVCMNLSTVCMKDAATLHGYG